MIFTKLYTLLGTGPTKKYLNFGSYSLLDSDSGLLIWILQHYKIGHFQHFRLHLWRN